MDDVDADYVIDAVRFIAERGYRFLAEYRFDPVSGLWQHRRAAEAAVPFSLQAALGAAVLSSTALPAAERARLFEGYLAEAGRLADGLREPNAEAEPIMEGQFGALQFFSA